MAYRANGALQQARHKKQWSRAFVAKQVEVHETTVGRWEQGAQKPRLEHLRKLCTLFDMSADDLGFGDMLNPS